MTARIRYRGEFIDSHPCGYIALGRECKTVEEAQAVIDGDASARFARVKEMRSNNARLRGWGWRKS